MTLVKSLYRVILKDIKKSKMPNSSYNINKLKKHIRLNKSLDGPSKDKAIDGMIFQIKMLSKPDRDFRPLP